MSNASVMRIVFSNGTYVGIAAATSVTFFIIFNMLDEYLFLSPFFAFSVPPDTYPNFALSIAVVALLGIVISMNVYSSRINGTKLKQSTTWLSGSFIATASGACGCSSLGFAIISSLGGAGIAATSFATTYQIPLKIASLAILIFAYYSVRKNTIRNCSVRN